MLRKYGLIEPTSLTESKELLIVKKKSAVDLVIGHKEIYHDEPT